MSEQSEAKRIGATLQKNSGRGTHAKGDATWQDEYVVDFKEYGKSFTLNSKIWSKVCTDAVRVDPMKEPLLWLVLGNADSPTRLAVLDSSHLEHLHSRINYLEERLAQYE